jgi:hypothetical protein
MAALIREASQDAIEAHKVHIRGVIIGNHEMSPICQDARPPARVSIPNGLSART